MSFSTETTRLCRYHGCWRDIVTDAPSMLIGHGVEPNPLREALHDLLYADDDHGYPGLQGTLYEWMRSLKINLPESTPLSDMVHRIANHPKLMEHSSTPVYAELVHSLTRKLRRWPAFLLCGRGDGEMPEMRFQYAGSPYQGGTGETSPSIGGGENPWRTVGHHQGVRDAREPQHFA